MQADRWRLARGPLTLAALILFPVALWARSVPPGTFDRMGGSLSAIGIAFGLAGVTSLALNLVLGARVGPLQRYFGGLEALYRAHRVNGRIAYLGVLAHVCLIFSSRVLDSGLQAFRIFTPGAGTTIFLGVIAFVAMTIAIGLTLYVRLGHEMFVYVQRSFGFVFVVVTLHVFATAGAKASSRALTIYLGVIAVSALIAFAYRSVFGNLLVRRFDYIVSEVRELDPSVVEITMRPVDKHLSSSPGQFVFVTFYSDRFDAQFHPVSLDTTGTSATVVLRPGEVHSQFHPFSLTSIPGEGALRLVVKAVGGFTAALHQLESGAIARVEGPYGVFSHLRMEHARQIWIAGGIGITPFLSMARSLVTGRFSIDLYYGVKSRSEAHFGDELEEIARRVEGFRLFLVPEDEQGFISAEMVRRNSAVSQVDVLIVGPPAMMTSLRAQLIEAGVAPRHVHSERFAFGPGE